MALAVTASSCTNSVAKKVKLASNGTSSTIAGTPLIVISKVLRNNLDPSGTFDVIGDNTNSMGTYCTSTASPASNQGASTCVCHYSYSVTDPADSTIVTSESVDVDTIYHEGNLIRCRFNTIPSSVSSVNVQVKVTTSNNISDAYAFNFLSSSAGLDTSSPLSFAKVYRYTCRDIVTIENLFDTKANGGSGIYDPIQSEDPRISYPLNYYTTNIGFTLNAYAGGAKGVTAPSLWECPANPLKPPTNFQLTIYSQAGLASGGSKVISPGSDMNAYNARSTFYLAKAQSGVFQIPFDSYVAPTIHSYPLDSQGNVQGGIPPLGYAASPVSAGVSGTENCPDSTVTIPAKYHWVKVWLFRMALPTRKFLTSSKFQQLGNVSCNPGPWNPATNYSNSYYNLPFNDCDGARSLDTRVDYSLVARFFEGTGMCVKPTAGGTTNAAGALIAPYSSYGPQPGTDQWVPNNAYPGYRCKDPSTGVANPSRIDPTNVCSTTPPNMAIDTAPLTQNLDDASNPRFDFIFVTTPATVMSRDMSDSSSSIYAQYAPYRFRADADCGAADPDAAGCSAQKAFRTYGIKFHDVGSAGDPPADNPNRPGVFPVCALQPDP